MEAWAARPKTVDMPKIPIIVPTPIDPVSEAEEIKRAIAEAGHRLAARSISKDSDPHFEEVTLSPSPNAYVKCLNCKRWGKASDLSFWIQNRCTGVLNRARAPGTPISKGAYTLIFDDEEDANGVTENCRPDLAGAHPQTALKVPLPSSAKKMRAPLEPHPLAALR